jgi:hypothetical protein
MKKIVTINLSKLWQIHTLVKTEVSASSLTTEQNSLLLSSVRLRPDGPESPPKVKKEASHWEYLHRTEQISGALLHNIENCK